MPRLRRFVCFGFHAEAGLRQVIRLRSLRRDEEKIFAPSHLCVFALNAFVWFVYFVFTSSASIRGWTLIFRSKRLCLVLVNRHRRGIPASPRSGQTRPNCSRLIHPAANPVRMKK